ncbi:hypothetical protein ABVT39_001352 [Epinephelus coioides]
MLRPFDCCGRHLIVKTEASPAAAGARSLVTRLSFDLTGRQQTVVIFSFPTCGEMSKSGGGNRVLQTECFDPKNKSSVGDSSASELCESRCRHGNGSKSEASGDNQSCDLPPEMIGRQVLYQTFY